MVVLGLVSPLVAPLLILIFYPFYRQLQVTTRTSTWICATAGRRGCAWPDCSAGPHGLVGSGHLLSGPGSLGHDGIGLYPAIFLMGIIATAYATAGGLSAVIWTDVLQFSLLAGGALWVAWL